MFPLGRRRAALLLGCVSGVLLAVSAFLSGALPGGDPGPGLRTGGFGAVGGPFLAGLGCWLLGLTGWTLAWWWSRPMGGGAGGTTAGRMLARGALWAVPLLVAPPLGSRDGYAYACQGWLWRTGLDPYTLGVADGGCPWADAVPELWWHTPTPYGPLAVALSGAGTWADLSTAVAWLRLLALAGLALAAVFGPRLARACGVAPAAAYWLGLLSPLVAVHAVSGAHNDALVAGLTIAALALALPAAAPPPPATAPGSEPVIAAARPASGVATGSRPDPATGVTRPGDSGRAAGGGSGPGWALLAGVLLAGAVAVKVTALVVLPFLLLLVGRRWWAALGGAVLSFAGLSAATGLGLGWVAALRGTGELAQWSSPPTALGMAAGYLLRLAGRVEWFDAAVAAGRVLGLLMLAAVALAALRAAWRGRGEPARVLAACGWLVAATALLGPVFYPWYALVPLALLAAVEAHPGRRRALAVAAIVCACLTLPNGLGVPVLTKTVGAFAVTGLVVWAAVRLRRGSTATA
ncbi:polyprenol phosphomannose-dependent alpha 1,6 mannosyltransferase MptB [Catellatospora sp. KI3]|uniref:polyprenol phosphomannose-dependent alpha 1,6 mannosyltransferase MptB n=1 Tax=Catellatospora sp. KI3 TaxID=3041620 RepID=UPI0024824BF3|nr:polyprenol phosphomannose-dependent alpha 1,6 mannosyltransferase MptB [Catellatospora sp. KI3]MDI1464903.1 polyprenol phosphomannose-dependent alpha 1,6 mannosyltransferase MptB [Catellatospora sp. KI3]